MWGLGRWVGDGGVEEGDEKLYGCFVFFFQGKGGIRSFRLFWGPGSCEKKQVFPRRGTAVSSQANAAA